MTDAKFMRLALAEARKSLKDGNYPVGAVLVTEGKVIGMCGNCVQNKKDWISHAELAVLQKNSSIVSLLSRRKFQSLYTRRSSHVFSA
jgi:tRNA(adenine34) deaminase